MDFYWVFICLKYRIWYGNRLILIFVGIGVVGLFCCLGIGGDWEFILGVFIGVLFVIVMGGRLLRFIVDFVLVLVGVGISRYVLLLFFFSINFLLDLISLRRIVR